MARSQTQRSLALRGRRLRAVRRAYLLRELREAAWLELTQIPASQLGLLVVPRYLMLAYHSPNSHPTLLRVLRLPGESLRLTRSSLLTLQARLSFGRLLPLLLSLLDRSPLHTLPTLRTVLLTRRSPLLAGRR